MNNIKEKLAKIAILNDLLDSELSSLTLERDSNLGKLQRTTKQTTKYFDEVLTDRAETFSELYEKTEECINSIVKNILK